MHGRLEKFKLIQVLLNVSERLRQSTSLMRQDDTVFWIMIKCHHFITKFSFDHEPGCWMANKLKQGNDELSLKKYVPPIESNANV